MIGDKLVIEPKHRRAAAQIVRLIEPRIADGSGVLTLTVAGESGSGKSETAQALSDRLTEDGISTVVLQQDDYFILPPKSNHRARMEDIGWVGPGEVRLDLLDAHLEAALSGAEEISKPLVIYDDDRIVEETVSLDGVRVVIAEGTYTTALDHAHVRVFIDLTFHQTKRARLERAREEQDTFLEEVLEIEHRIISGHKGRADLIIDSGFEVRSV